MGENFFHEKLSLFLLRKNDCGKREKRHTEIYSQIESYEQFPNNRVFQLFRTAAPVESAENATSKLQ